ncbi:MAG: hypothetical protein C4329_01420 [Chitinophagaceae bacterium]
MKNAYLLFFTFYSEIGFAQGRSASLQTNNAATSIKTAAIPSFIIKKNQLNKKMITPADASFKQDVVRVMNIEKDSVKAEQLNLDKFNTVATLNGTHLMIEDKAKLSIFNECTYAKETGIYSFNLFKVKWKGLPYIYCINCGTALLQLKVVKDKNYFVHFFLTAEDEKTYELLLSPSMLSPEQFHLSEGAQELMFFIKPKASGYLSYYLRCVEPGSWKLLQVQVSEQ